MKKQLRLLIAAAFSTLAFSFQAKATNYYFSSSTGNDSYTAAQAQNPATPWKTLSKLNSFFSSLQAGDSVLFLRGDSFYGSITPTKSGTAALPIVFSAYGTGNNPVITGGLTLNTWTNLGGGIYETPLASKPAVVAIANKQYAPGRYPDNGWLNIDATNGSSITSTGLSGQTGLVGASVVIRKNRTIIDKGPILTQSGNTITYNISYSSTQQDYGFFITDKLSTLTTYGEWFYDNAAQKLKVYFGASGTAPVTVSNISQVIVILAKSNLSFRNLDINFANDDLVQTEDIDRVSFSNCKFSYSGGTMLIAGGNTNTRLSVTNCTVRNINNDGIHLYGGNNDGLVIQNNTFTNIGSIPGEGGNGDGTYSGILMEGNACINADISYNHIDTVGYAAISGGATNVLIRNNVINYFCFLKDDGGAIYIQEGQGTGKRITGNIIRNGGIGVESGTDGGVNNNQAMGIYSDAGNAYTEMDNNSITNCNVGIYMDDSHDINIHHNTVFDNGMGIAIDFFGTQTLSNLTIKNNIGVNSDNSSTVFAPQKQVCGGLALNAWGTIDFNYWCRPVADNATIYTNDCTSGHNYTLAQWQAASPYDANSHKSPIALTDPNKIRFEYNETGSPRVVPLTANYMTVDGTVYTGSVTIPAYGSVVLLQTSASPNQAPTANAGANKTITLPTSTVTLTGSGTDPDGTISAYAWTKISGPASSVIVSPTAAQTVINSLVQGVYQFELKVTDNSGATGRDTVVVTVNPGNQAPTANAGADKIITLPTNTVTLTGSGTDPDGTISTYAWTKISGPACTIATPAAATTAINSLLQGTYQFQLLVTDNGGATGKDTVIVTVNAAAPPPNQAPTANAGTDRSITLPTNTVSLAGSGSDPDGTISAYAWTKISGPTCTIVTPASATTTINNMLQGTYQFQLQVTDNAGATGKDTVIITVNAAAPPPNQAPTANAGTDILITVPASSVTLNGSGTDADGTISAYAWTKIAGPATGTIVNAASASTVVNSLSAGIYQFELKVTDNAGATGKDTVTVTVNRPPTANAGADKNITLPTNTVTLTGIGSDPDGTVSAYAWTKISGPTCTIVAPAASQTIINNLLQGTYQFELLVTDNAGATGKDTVIVTVNAAAPPPNQAPVANAGADKSITLPTNTVSLIGSGTDPDGTISAYAWTKISGPTCTIATPASATTAINNLLQGTYQFQLQVTDNAGATGKDTVTVTVNAAAPPPNQAPTANAGADKSITLPTNTVTLNGTGTDADGTISAYAWTKISGPTCTIATPAAATTAINNLLLGTYQFQLQVTDNAGATGKDTVTVTVNAAAPPPNQAPTANAGADKSITLPTNTVTLNGTGTDADGTISAYVWTKISGPACTIVTPATATTIINNLLQGTYQFELQVTDNAGATGKDTVTVTVNAAAPPPNQAPVANAGADKSITLPANTVTLNGTGTDADGTISAYAWTKISGPTCTIATPAAATTAINNLLQGTYQFQLQVTDNAGATGRDTVTVTVNAAAPPPNQAPIANAGANQSITLPANSVTLNGSGTDADGTITGYLWSKITGPAGNIIANAGAAQTTVSNLTAGTYQFELKVTDNAGATGRDTMTVTVSQATSTPPSVNAGSDQTDILPVNYVIVAGTTRIDADVTATYLWTKISGPSRYSITSPDSLQTEITYLEQGYYLFELKVTDSRGAIGRDTLAIEVLPAPATLVGTYPNPVTSTLNMTLNQQSGLSFSRITVYNSLGVAVLKDQITGSQNITSRQLNFASFKNGFYIVEAVLSNHKTETFKIVKQ